MRIEIICDKRIGGCRNGTSALFSQYLAYDFLVQPEQLSSLGDASPIPFPARDLSLNTASGLNETYLMLIR